MKILYIRRIDCIYLKGFTDIVNLPSNEVFVLDLRQGKYSDLRKNKITYFIKMRFLLKIPGIKYLMRYVAALLFMVKYQKTNWDISHILNLKRENFWLLLFLHFRSKNVIVTIFGRSTYINKMKRVCFRPVYKYVKYITFEHKDSMQEFREFNMNISDKQMVRLYPPISHFRKKEFEFNKVKKTLAVKDLGLEPGLIHLACSSTISSYDQHYKVIDALTFIRDKEKVQLMFLLTYGGSEKEKKKIIKYINEHLASFNVKIFTSFLSVEEIIKYRFATDIYVNMRITDQLAGAVLETVAGGSILITGSWLKYNDFDEQKIQYKKVNDFHELTICLNESINSVAEFEKIYSKENSRKIIEAYAFENISEKWLELYSF